MMSLYLYIQYICQKYLYNVVVPPYTILNLESYNTVVLTNTVPNLESIGSSLVV